MSASFDFLSGEYDLLHFHGRHFNEMNLERTHVGHELITIGNRRGFSGHQQNAFAILAEKDAGEEHGSCYGMSLMYSGNFKLEAEQDQYNQTRIQMGISDELLDYRLAQGESFAAPEVLMVYSDAGLTTLSHRYHHFIRHHVCRGPYKTKRRPILVNNWEATYFDFTGEKLLEIGRVAKDLGIEMFVLDDGWFGARDLDDKGLGDWVVNEEKMGGPLSRVVNEMNDMGLQFGLWIEPEMVNENSDLYRTHPEWAFQIPGKKPVLGRGQLVLDYTRKEVVDGILDQICKVIDSANISYIKMDMNRSLCDLYSYGSDTQNFGTLMYRYVKGVYYFLDQLLTRYPELLIEGCASGGARFDAGMMYYTPQIWTSDNSDAIERLNIQYGASFGYPVSVVGSHVSAVPNHQNGRITKLQTRGVVAMSGNFGYELDLTKLTEEEKEEIKEQIAVFKENWELIHNGTYYRATTKEEQSEYVAWNMVSEDKEKALLNVVTTNTHGNKLPIYAKCKGLQKDALYVCEETKEVYAGQVLATIGMPILMLDTTFGTPLPLVDGEYNAFQFHFTMQK
jgi:alpha-galactosidase